MFGDFFLGRGKLRILILGSIKLREEECNKVISILNGFSFVLEIRILELDLPGGPVSSEPRHPDIV